MTGALQTHRFTVDEYHRLSETGVLGSDDRVELKISVADVLGQGSRRRTCRRCHALVMARGFYHPTC